MHRVRVTEVKAAQRGAAATAVARALGLPLADAKVLLQVAGVLPCDLPEPRALSLIQALERAGVAAEQVNVPPGSTARCPAHPSLSPDRPCESCRSSMCAVCAARGEGLCGRCAARANRKRRFQRMRVTVLLLVLAGVAAWAYERHQRLSVRTQWMRPLRVSIVLLSPSTANPDVASRWKEGAASLEAWFAAELVRYRGTTGVPFQLEVLGPVVRRAPPDFQPQLEGWLDRARHAWALARELREIDSRAELRPGDAAIYVWLEPHRGSAAAAVEGVAEAGGTAGMVRAPADELELTLPLTAVAHEILHCLGAKDRYDAEGHAASEDAVAEPDRRPLFPQRYAEVMVGELALGPHSGRLANSLSEVRVGPLTAAEIRWISP